MTTRLVWSSAAYSHVGLVRKVNEDSFMELPHLGEHAGIWAVADGMGGHEAGDVASQTIVGILKKLPVPDNPKQMVGTIKQALFQANTQLQQTSDQQYKRQTIGSTVVVLAAFDTQGFVIWAGDSRIYRYRNGQLEQMTHDHSHVQEMVDRGLLKPEEAEHHPYSNVITRAVGSNDDLELDDKSFELAAGDVFLLCSDGLSKMIERDEIIRCLAESNSHNSAQELIHAALDKGADDNVTVIVVNIRATDEVDDTANTIPVDSMVSKLKRKFGL